MYQLLRVLVLVLATIGVLSPKIANSQESRSLCPMAYVRSWDKVNLASRIGLPWIATEYAAEMSLSPMYKNENCSFIHSQIKIQKFREVIGKNYSVSELEKYYKEMIFEFMSNAKYENAAKAHIQIARIISVQDGCTVDFGVPYVESHFEALKTIPEFCFYGEFHLNSAKKLIIEKRLTSFSPRIIDAVREFIHAARYDPQKAISRLILLANSEGSPQNGDAHYVVSIIVQIFLLYSRFEYALDVCMHYRKIFDDQNKSLEKIRYKNLEMKDFRILKSISFDDIDIRKIDKKIYDKNVYGRIFPACILHSTHAIAYDLFSILSVSRNKFAPILFVSIFDGHEEDRPLANLLAPSLERLRAKRRPLH